MPPAFENFREILIQEQRLGYKDKAVSGGLERFAYNWSNIALKEATTKSEELLIEKIVVTLKKYSDFVSYPITVGDDQANQQLSLWRKSPSEASAEEYNQFYQQMTMDFNEPLKVIHFTSDAPLNIRALLYIPANREKSMLNLRKEPGLMLYSQNVMIQEYSNDLLPPWLGFVDGVVR